MVKLTSPADGAKISGSVTISGVASDNGKLISVQLELDGVSIGPSLTSSPFASLFSSVDYANGAHRISAVATDFAGLTTTTSISVNIANQTSSSERKRRLPSAVPYDSVLEQNHPNPFNPSTTLQYSLLERSSVSLIIYNVLGVEVAHLAGGVQEAGTYSVAWNANDASSGVYLARLVTSDSKGAVIYSRMRKMLLLK